MSEEEVEKEVTRVVESALLENPSLFIVEVSFKGSSGARRLSVFLDGDDGISIDQCVKVSRKLSGFLEENEELIVGKYFLEVSSAGVDQPLKLARQYKRNVGRTVKVKLKDGEQTEGILSELTESGLRVTVKEKKIEKLVEIGFDQIESTKVLVSFK